MTLKVWFTPMETTFLSSRMMKSEMSHYYFNFSILCIVKTKIELCKVNKTKRIDKNDDVEQKIWKLNLYSFSPLLSFWSVKKSYVEKILRNKIENKF